MRLGCLVLATGAVRSACAGARRSLRLQEGRWERRSRGRPGAVGSRRDAGPHRAGNRPLRSDLERVSSGAERRRLRASARDEVENARTARAILVAVYERQLEALAQVEAQRKGREAAEKADREWPGFPQKQPFAILLLDSLREETDTRRGAAGLLKSHRGVIDIEFDRLRGRAEQAAEALRRASEAVERATEGTDARAAAAWRLEAARGEERLAAEFVVASDLAAQALDAKLAVAQLELRLAERKLAALAGKATIGKADVDEALRRLETFRAERERELQSLLEASARSRRERDEAARALSKFPERDRVRLLAEARLRSAEVRVQSEGQQVRILTTLVNLYHSMVAESWSWRYTVLAETDPDARQEARRRVAALNEYLTLWESRATTELNEVRSALREQAQRVRRAASGPELEKHERNARDALRELDLALGRQHDEIARRLARLAYWQQEFAESLKARSMQDIGARAAGAREGERGPGLELRALHDRGQGRSRRPDGHDLPRRHRRQEHRRGSPAAAGLSPAHVALQARERDGGAPLRPRRGAGKTLRRWVNALGMVALLMLTLNLARIPLTVFAFAGGALAIGIGFGTQTLIKNLISGMIVLVERNVRVGDIIEVEGITGRVTAVDVRSSTVRAADSVQSMIPNSMLLEQKVTNWTLTDAHLRRVSRSRWRTAPPHARWRGSSRNAPSGTARC